MTRYLVFGNRRFSPAVFRRKLWDLPDYLLFTKLGDGLAHKLPLIPVTFKKIVFSMHSKGGR